MNSQKGIAPIVLVVIVIIVLAAGVGGSILIFQEKEEKAIPASKSTEEQAQEPESQPELQPEQLPEPELVPEQESLSEPIPLPAYEPEQETTPVQQEEEPFVSQCPPREFDEESYYTGPLFDAHFHMPLALDYSEAGGHAAPDHPVLGKDLTLDDILCFFDEESVRGAIAFNTIPDETKLNQSVEAISDINNQSSGKIRFFLMPTNLEAGTLDSVQNANSQLFKGYGEIALYDPSLQGVTPSSQKMQDIYDVAKKYDLVVMMHPDAGQKGDIETALQNNPDVNFLLHGFESEDYVTDLMDWYPNLYFSIDSAVLYPMMGLFMSGPKEVFISRLEQDFNSILNDKLNKWKSRIKKHPDRFMWGTDRGVVWHYNKEISLLFEKFARAFIVRLDPAVQENYAYRNAERLLQSQ